MFLSGLKHYRKLILTLLILISIGAYIIYVKYTGVIPDSVISLFPELEHPTPNDRILIFAPHQDDELLGSGGLIVMASREGASIKIIIATNGNQNGLKAVRYSEALAAADFLGLDKNDLIFWDYPDTKLESYKKSLAPKIADLINEYQPTMIIAPNPDDHHRDHIALGKAVFDYLKSSNYQGEALEYLVHYKGFPRPLGYYPRRNLLPPSRLISADRKWYKLSLTGEVEAMKYGAISQYKSQLQVPWLKSLLLSFIRENELFSKM